MLVKSKLIDLLSGKMSNEIAYEYLLKMSEEKPSAASINELVTAILNAQEDISLKLFDTFAAQNDIIDCCGTGGSGISHYNTSTSVAFVLAAGGLKVAKFGNRAASSTSGSFDFLDYLGFPIISSQSDLLEIIQQTNLCFIFAPHFYPSLTRLGSLRKRLGKRTLFNLIGPLLNPLQPSHRILGTPTIEAQQAIAEYFLLYKNYKKVLVVRAESGLDELDVAANNDVILLDKQSMSRNYLKLALNKESFAQDSIARQHSTTAKENANLFMEMINSSLSPTNYFQTLVTFNAGAAFYVAGKTSSIEEGQNLAENLLLSGAVLNKYEQCRRAYAKHAR